MSTLNYHQLKKEFVAKAREIDRLEKMRDKSKKVSLSTLKQIQSNNLPWKYSAFIEAGKKKVEA